MLIRGFIIIVLLIAISALGLVISPRFLPEDHAVAQKGKEVAEQIKGFAEVAKVKINELADKIDKQAEGVEIGTSSDDLAAFDGSDVNKTVSRTKFPISRRITDSKGRKINVKVTRIEKGDIVFVKDNSSKVFRFPISDLSIDDQEYFMDLGNAKKVVAAENVESDPFQ